MVSVKGTINIRAVSGRFGPFNVGTLDCSIGKFTVKDSSIEEFDEGSYDGDFVIALIEPKSYFSSGRMIVEVRATLSAIMLDKCENHLPAVHESFEQDPLEEELDTRVSEVVSRAKPERDEANESGDVDVDVPSLFGVLWPLGNIVKLDPTIGRAVFRQQKEYLKNQAGYRFVSEFQHWVKD